MALKVYEGRRANPRPKRPPKTLRKPPKEIQRRQALSEGSRPGRVFTVEGKPATLRGTLRGSAIFVLCGGPSTNDLDLSLFQRRGVVTMAINNSWLTTRPHFWVSNDGPTKFVPQGWRDPGITKFIPQQLRNHNLNELTPEGEFEVTTETVQSCPNVYFFDRISEFNSGDFWTQEKITWGNGPGVTDDLGIKGTRATMLTAIKLCHYLGAGTINVVGADFFIPESPDDQAYAFGETKEKSQLRQMPGQYRDLNTRLKAVYDNSPIRLFNCTPGGKMDAWPRKPFEQAIKDACGPCETDGDGRGWYTRKRK